MIGAAAAITPIKAEAGEPAAGKAELKKAVAEFESIFINEMLKSMRSTVMKSDLMHDAHSEDVYNSMLDAELSRFMARSGGIGLSEVLLRQLDQSAASSGAADGASAGVSVAAPADAATQAATPAPAKGEFSSPLADFIISSRFGVRRDPFTGRDAFHHGLDMAAPEGAPVYPASAGVVAFSGFKEGYGNVVEIEHPNGFRTRYGHHSRNLVAVGDAVEPGRPIAYVGSTGRSTGAHLHFEVIKDGVAVDPGPILRAVG